MGSIREGKAHHRRGCRSLRGALERGTGQRQRHLAGSGGAIANQQRGAAAGRVVPSHRDLHRGWLLRRQDDFRRADAGRALGWRSVVHSARAESGRWRRRPVHRGFLPIGHRLHRRRIDSTSTATNSTLAEHWDGTSWTVEPSPDPAGTTVTDLVGVSCASPASCTATGLYDKKTGGSAHEVPLAEHWNGSSWTVQTAPLPADAIAADLDGGVSCPSATECTAVGGWTGPSQTGGPLVESWNGVKWQVQATPALPAGAYNPFFAGVSCTSARNCTAVGGYLNGNVEESLVERWDGTSWTIQADAAPAGTAMDSVSCTSSASCTAVGGGEAEHWDGTSWTLQPPMPIPHHATRGVAVPGVSCRSAVTCTAVGLYGRQAHPLAEHE